MMDMNMIFPPEMADASNEAKRHTYSQIKKLDLLAAFPLWRCFAPVNVLPVHLPARSLAKPKNLRRIPAHFYSESV